MALINCPECNKQISSETKNCPHCGYPLRKVENREQRHKFILCLIVSLVVCGIGFGWYFIQQKREEVKAAIEAHHKFLTSIPAPKSYKDAYDYYLRYKVSDDNWHTFSTAIRLDEVRNVPFYESMIIKDWESIYSKYFSY